MDELSKKNLQFKYLDNLLVIDTQCSVFKLISNFPINFVSYFRILMCEILFDPYFLDHSTLDLSTLISQFDFKEVLAPIRKSDDGIYAKG
jgi:hypothetical protein